MRHDSAPGATQPGAPTTQPVGTAAGFRVGTLRDLPLVESRHDLAGIPTAVLEGGDGPTVVLLHGPGEFAALWGRVIPGLTETHRVVVPDLPGHGATGLPTDGPLDAERWLDWLRALIALTTPRPPALVGHLAGGALALRHAVDGGPVERIVLVDSAGLAFNRPAPSFAAPLAGFLGGAVIRDRLRDVSGSPPRPAADPRPGVDDLGPARPAEPAANCRSGRPTVRLAARGHRGRTRRPVLGASGRRRCRASGRPGTAAPPPRAGLIGSAPAARQGPAPADVVLSGVEDGR
jgi:pimeloyl-ACP methyl ester carboxylesterase